MTPQHDNILDQRESIETDEFLIKRQWQQVEIDDNWLDPTEKYTRPRYTLSYNHVPFAPLGGLHGLTGQPGHGKTMTFTQLMVAILKGEFYGLRYELRADIPSPKVLYIDTEMEKGNTQLVMLRVYEMMGWQEGSIHDEFRILWLREVVSAEDRWRKVLKAISSTQPTVVFLDGLIDVISDFNDNKECQEIIYECMATASHYGISLWCLLHENPGTTKMVGHAGSFLERKATDVLQTKKEKVAGHATFKVAQIKARARDLDEWKFTIEDGNNQYGCPVLSDVETTASDLDGQDVNSKSDGTFNPDDLRNMIDYSIGTESLSFTALREHLKDRYNIGSGKAKVAIDQAVGLGYLVCRDNRYIKLIQTNLLDDPNEEAPI